MNKKVQFIVIILIYFGIFHDVFHPLLEGNIKSFFIKASLPIFIIVLGLFVSAMNDKLGYWDSENDKDEEGKHTP